MSSIISSCDNIKRRENTYFAVALSSIHPVNMWAQDPSARDSSHDNRLPKESP
jgi:hypothetical protein